MKKQINVLDMNIKRNPKDTIVILCRDYIVADYFCTKTLNAISGLGIKFTKRLRDYPCIVFDYFDLYFVSKSGYLKFSRGRNNIKTIEYNYYDDIFSGFIEGLVQRYRDEDK